MAAERKATVSRETGETRIRLEITIDGRGRCQASTGIGMLDHLIDQIARHGLFDIGVEAKGDLEVGQHHTLEDVAIGPGIQPGTGGTGGHCQDGACCSAHG